MNRFSSFDTHGLMIGPLAWQLKPTNPSNAKTAFVQSTRMQRFFGDRPNPVMLVFIGKLSLSILR